MNVGKLSYRMVTVSFTYCWIEPVRYPLISIFYLRPGPVEDARAGVVHKTRYPALKNECPFHQASVSIVGPGESLVVTTIFVKYIGALN